MKVSVRTTIGEVIVNDIAKIIEEKDTGYLKLLREDGHYSAKLDLNRILGIDLIHDQKLKLKEDSNG